MELGDLQRDWTRLGAEDPLWAVYVAPGTRGGRWDVEEFLASGREEVTASLDRLAALGAAPGTGTALDFGCGVGRLSNALAAHVEHVVGVDISPSMLEHARLLDRSDGRCRFVLNEREDLALLDDASVDLVYSSLALQHMPRLMAVGYLREFARVLRPGGAAVLQVVSRPTRSLKGGIARWTPRPVMGWAQQRLLGYPAPMLMEALPARVMTAALEGTGLRVLDAVDDDSYGSHWVCTRWFLART